MKKDIYQNITLDKLMNEFNCIKKIKNNSYTIDNTLYLSKTPRNKKYQTHYILTKRDKNNDLIITPENNKKNNNEEMKKICSMKIKKFKDALKSLKNKPKLNFSSNDFYSDEKRIKNKKNQISSLSSTKASKNNTLYFNSFLDDYYNKISNKKFRIITPLNKYIKRERSFLPLKRNINFFSDKKNNNEKKEKKINIKKVQRRNIKDNLVNSPKFNSFNKTILNNIFQKSKTKVKLGILDGVILNYKLDNNDIITKPFNNSYNFMINVISDKIKFLKNSLNFIYPSIFRKRYLIKENQNKKNNLLRNNSQEIFRRNKNEVKNDIYKINEDKKVSQSVFTKYPIYIKLKGKYSPCLYSLRNNSSQKNNKKQNIFNKITL